MSAYDGSGDLSDIAVRPEPLPAGTVVQFELTKPGEAKTIGAKNTPAVEFSGTVTGGEGKGLEVRKTIWVGTEISEGKTQSAWQAAGRRGFKELAMAFMPETKANTFFQNCASLDDWVNKANTLVGKPCRITVTLETSKKGHKFNVIDRFVPYANAA